MRSASNLFHSHFLTSMAHLASFLRLQIRPECVLVHLLVVDDEPGSRSRRSLVQALARDPRRRVSCGHPLLPSRQLARGPAGVERARLGRLTDEALLRRHEDARCGPGVGVSKGTRSRKKAVNLDEAESSAPSTSKKKTTKASTSKKAAASAKKASENEGEEAVPATKKAKREREGGREVLLAKSFDLETKKQDPTGWWISEKRESSRSLLVPTSMHVLAKGMARRTRCAYS